jgi:hypothetical protein
MATEGISTPESVHADADSGCIFSSEGESLEYPNGLLVRGGKLNVGRWGKPEADFSTKVPGRLFA